MFMETPQTILYLTGGAFLLGWLVGKIGAYFGNKIADKKRDPRDDRIRSLEAELRIAVSDSEKLKGELEGKAKELKDSEHESLDLNKTMNEQLDLTTSLRKDLRESVKKTRELRAELSDRATENIKSEVKLREVETELSVAQAATDMIATGVLDYSEAPDAEDEEDGSRVLQAST
jgi:ribosome-binding ATPase YchF (GTP1/OBG family)